MSNCLSQDTFEAAFVNHNPKKKGVILKDKYFHQGTCEERRKKRQGDSCLRLVVETRAMLVEDEMCQ